MKDKLNNIWGFFLSTPYISAQPGIRHRISFPKQARADTNPVLNQQPWYHGSNFGYADRTQDEIIVRKDK